MRLFAIEMGDLAQVIWVSLLASAGIAASYSFVVLGTARSAEARRSRRTGAAIAYGTLSALFLCLLAVAVVLGVRIMLTKR